MYEPEVGIQQPYLEFWVQGTPKIEKGEPLNPSLSSINQDRNVNGRPPQDIL